jgi:transposase
MAVEITRKDHSVGDLRREAARAKGGKAARRMLALALVLEGKSRSEAAEQCGMDRQTLRDWVHRYHQEGLAGLADRPLSGRPPRLTPKQMDELKAIVEAGADPVEHGVVRFRRIDLCKIAEYRFGIRIAERTMGSLLRKLGFGRLSVRPQHPRSDPEAQDLYKKLWRSRAPGAARGGARQAA